MASMHPLCDARDFSDIMDAQAYSHSYKLIYHWVKVTEQNSLQTKALERACVSYCSEFYYFPFSHDEEENFKQ